MDVYFIENENPCRDSSGGIMSYLINLSKFLQKNGVKTYIIGTGFRKGISSNKSFSRVLSLSENNISNYKYLVKLFIKINELVPSKGVIIHAQRPDMLIPAIIFKRKNKLLCSLHGAHDKAVFDKKGTIHGIIYSFLQTISFYFADLLIAVDEKTKMYYIKKYNWLNKKIVTIPIGVDTEKFYPMDKKRVRKKYNFNENDKILIFVGRIEKEKNIGFLLDAFDEAQKTIKELKFIIVGDGREKIALKLKVKKRNIKKVFFLGELPNGKIPEVLNIADIFVLASLYEGSPTVIKEALACNIPVVSVDVGDVKSVIQNFGGSYIAKRDKVDFAQKIVNVLNDKNKYDYQTKIKQYSIDFINVCTLKIYKKLIGNYG